MVAENFKLVQNAFFFSSFKFSFSFSYPESILSFVVWLVFPSLKPYCLGQCRTYKPHIFVSSLPIYSSCVLWKTNIHIEKLSDIWRCLHRRSMCFVEQNEKLQRQLLGSYHRWLFWQQLCWELIHVVALQSMLQDCKELCPFWFTLNVYGSCFYLYLGDWFIQASEDCAF